MPHFVETFICFRELFLPESAGVVRLMDSAVKLKRIGWPLVLRFSDNNVFDHRLEPVLSNVLFDRTDSLK